MNKIFLEVLFTLQYILTNYLGWLETAKPQKHSINISKPTWVININNL